jgi:hypothetical protein
MEAEADGAAGGRRTVGNKGEERVAEMSRCEGLHE